MVREKINASRIEFIFFDKGGTISYQEPHDDNGVAAAAEIMEFLGYEGSPEDFRKLLKERDKKYKAWSLESCYEDTVEDMCSKWLFYDAPRMEKLKDNADKLIIMSSYVKGKRIMYPEAAPVIKTLKQRGYRIGLISNTVSPTMVPQELKNAGVYDELEVLVMSSVERLRKPDPAIFHLACERAGIDPSKCVYVGDAPNRDVEGPRKAGFAYVIILNNKNYNPETDIGIYREPDAVINRLEDLFELFPDKAGGANAD